MSALDLQRYGFEPLEVFGRVLYEEIGEAWGRHGLDAIHEDTLDEVVAECKRRVYYPSLADLRRMSGARSLLDI